MKSVTVWVTSRERLDRIFIPEILSSQARPNRPDPRHKTRAQQQQASHQGPDIWKCLPDDRSIVQGGRPPIEFSPHSE